MGNPMALIKKGESLPFLFDRDGQDVDGWVCTINVSQYPGDVPAISRVVEPTGNEWEGFLTSAETAALPALGVWRLIGVLTNATTDEDESVPVRFKLSEAWV